MCFVISDTLQLITSCNVSDYEMSTNSGVIWSIAKRQGVGFWFRDQRFESFYSRAKEPPEHVSGGNVEIAQL